MKIDNVFLAFLYSDKSEHLIYKKGEKFIDLINDNEINYLDIDLNSIRKYTNNKILYDDWRMNYIKRRVEENIDISVPFFSNRKNIIKEYEKYRNKLIDISDYSLMISKHHNFKRYDSNNDTLYYTIEIDKIAIYFNLFNDDYYDIFTGEVLKKYDIDPGYMPEPFLESYNPPPEFLLGNKVLRKDLYNYAYRIMAEDRERRSKE